MSLFNQLRHEPIKKRKHKRGNMCPVYIGIRHNDNFVIAKLRDIKILMDACSKCSNHGANLRIAVDSVQSCLLNIQNFSPKRKNRLRSSVTCGFCGTPCRVSLYDKYFTVFRIFIRAVCKLSWQRKAIQGCFSSGQFSGLSCRFSGSLRNYGFFNNNFSDIRMLLQINTKLLTDNSIYSPSCLAVSELLLGLSLKLRIFNFNADNRCQSFTDIFSGKVFLAVFQQLHFSSIIIKGSCNGLPESYDMHAAFRCKNIIDKSIHRLIIGIIMLHGNFHHDSVLNPLKIHNIRVQSLIASVQILNKFPDASLVMENFFFFFSFPDIPKCNFQTAGKKSSFSETCF